MKIFSNILAAGLAAGAFAGQAASADSLSWTFDNATEVNLSLEFYSRDRDRVWPGEDQVFIIGPSDGARTYELDCNQGETICYGAWVRGDAETSWGSGFNGQRTCGDCCAICGGGVAEPVELTP